MGDPDFAYKLQAAMKVPLTVTLGPMGAVLRQLHSPELVRLTKKKGVRRFREDIDRLCISLKDVSEADDPSFTAKLWIKEAREILYDTEDCINEVLRPGIAAAPKRLPKTANDLMVRVKDANGRRKRFSVSTLDPCPQQSVYVPLADTMSVHLDTGGDLDVGSMDKLLPLIAFDNETEKELKVVPIYGVAGIGKTTAATTLYRKFSTKFQCRAFLRVSRNPDMRRLLTSLLSQIKAPPAKTFADVNQLINTINEHLKDKRFFIIIDDLWTTSVWYIIRRAFPDDKCCSRIVTTTQMGDVALACCSYQHDIFMMHPLNYDQSRKLLIKRLDSSEGECPKHLKDHLDGIIRKCGGLPLAIVNIASMLASEANPENIQDLVSTIFGIISEELLSTSASSSEVVSPGDFKKMGLPVTALTSEGMKGITNLIYNKLPNHLQTCLLYLSMYPEDYPINKADLVKQCLAEGFLCTTRLTGEMGIPRGELEETVGRCFDELVNMGMIQPVDTDHDGGVLSYKVGHVVLDLIRCRSMEENFISVLDYFQTTPEELGYDKVRRLSIQSSGAKRARIPASYMTAQIRSLMFCGLLRCVPSVVDYSLLRVLILHIWAEEDGVFDLTGIDTLFWLRYLKVKCNITVQLPDKIGGLKYLETLEVLPATKASIPSDIGNLNKLVHLRLLIEDNLLHNMMLLRTSLLSLGYFDISSNSTENMRQLGELMNLQDLHLTCSTVELADKLKEKMKCLSWILGKLINLKSITLSSLVKGAGDVVGSSISISGDGWSWVSPDSGPAHLQRLELLPRVCIFPTLPNCLRGLLQLRILKIAVRKLLNEDIRLLKGLPALTALSLYVRTELTNWIRFDKEGFPVLKYFKFMCIEPYMFFKKGAMSNVRKLKIGFNASRTRPYVLQSVWFKRLAGLEEITAKIGGAGDDISKVESAFEDAISDHPGRPIIRVQRVDWVFDCEEEKSTATQEKQGEDEKGKDKEMSSSMIQEQKVRAQGQENDCIQNEGYSSNEMDSEVQEFQEERNTRICYDTASPSSGKRSTRRRKGAGGVGMSTLSSEGEIQILQSANVKSFTFTELRTSTRNFRPDSVLGEGRFGSVFKGWVDGMVIAIKTFNQEGFQGYYQEWLAEVNYLGRLSHPNLVRLVGYCLKDEQRLLVYEFMPRGSLENHLFRRGSLPWTLRMKVALGAARGLAFLHSDKANVIHRDFKTSNVLLDSSYNAKLSDFGMAKDGPTGDKSHVTTRVMGTYEYAAPEYLATGHLTAKSDVYSFGVVLLEMLSGRRTLDKNRPSGEHNLVKWARPYLTSKREIFHIIDTRLKGQFSIAGAHKAAALALQCLSEDARKRPDMAQVAVALEQLQDAKDTVESGGDEQQRTKAGGAYGISGFMHCCRNNYRRNLTRDKHKK